HAFGHSPANWRKQVEVVKSLQQTKGIAPSDEHGFGWFYRPPRVRGFVNRVQFISHRFQTPSRRCGISVAVMLREGHEQNTADGAQKISDLLFGVIKIAAPVKRRVTDQQESLVSAFHIGHISASVISLRQSFLMSSNEQRPPEPDQSAGDNYP